MMAGHDVRQVGLGDARLRYYGSDQVHGCHQTAVEVLGLGNKALRSIPSRDDCNIDVAALRAAIAADRAAGDRPACVIATAGTVNTGAVDDIERWPNCARTRGYGCMSTGASVRSWRSRHEIGRSSRGSLARTPSRSTRTNGCMPLSRSAVASFAMPQAHLATFTLSAAYLEPMVGASRRRSSCTTTACRPHAGSGR